MPVPFKEGADWELLDGLVSGECDEQANLMKKALNIIGVPADTFLVYASRHTDPDVLSLDSRPSSTPGYTDYLILMMPGPNAFEGCCRVIDNTLNPPERWYAVFPKIKANSVLDMLRALPGWQQWVRMMPGYVPGQGNNWAEGIDEYLEVEDKP